MRVEIKKRIAMIEKGEVPKGYKKTEYGIVPTQWWIKKLIDVGNIVTGSTPLRSDEGYFNGEIPWVKTTDLNNSYITSTEEKITEKALDETAVKLVAPNSILVAMYGGFNQIGRTGLTKMVCTTNQAIASFEVDEKRYNSEYILHWLNAQRDCWIRFAASSRKDPNITKKDVEDFPIFLMSYHEQKKISQVLSIWDRAIELKEKLLEQRKFQKKGLMERLLTGKVRLPGFQGGWSEISLKALLKERKEIGRSDLELLSITAQRGVVKRDEIDKVDTSSEDKSKYKRICPLDIGYNTMRMWQGVSGVSIYEGIVSPAYTVLKPIEKVDAFFIGYLFKLPKTINLFWRYSQGLVDDTLSIKYDSLKKIRVCMPPTIEEQRGIAEVLKLTDKNLGILQQDIEKLKTQKKGLMQLLLTGKVRVPC